MSNPSRSIHGSTSSDESLVQATVALHDRRAFAELVRRHEGRIRRWLGRVTRDPALADDLAQETFLRAYRGLARFEGRARFATWLHRIALYVWLNHRNRTRNLVELPAELEAALAAPEDMCSASCTDARRDVGRAVEALPRHYRDVVVAYFLRHVPYRDIADELGLPLGTVKVQLFRAKAMMRRHFDADAVPAVA